MSVVPEKYRGVRSFAFGDGSALADELLDLVLRGLDSRRTVSVPSPLVGEGQGGG